MFDFGLDESTELLRRTAREFARAHVAPIADKVDATNTFPRELWPRFGELGLLGITVSEEDGGSGMGYLQHIIVLEELTRCSASIGMSYGAHSNLVLNQLKLNATKQQKSRYLPRLLTGEHVAALAMTEASAGSDIVGMRLRADKRGDRYVLNGSKMWITNGAVADVLLVYAKTDLAAGKDGISASSSRATFRAFASRAAWIPSACAAPAQLNSCSKNARFRRKILSAN